MPELHLAAALGHFVIGWSSIEAVVEVAIKKQLRLKPLESSIVTARLQFRSRSMILMSLLNLDPTKNAEAITVLKEIRVIQERNDILHSIVGGSESVIWFNRRKTEDTFKSKIETYDANRLSDVALKCSNLSGALMKALKIRKQDYLSFLHKSHKAANKV